MTDANLMLGRLAGGSTLAGGVELDREAAEAAVTGLARSLGLEPLETAAGIIRVADQEMVRALRVVTVERGVDPRRFALLPFGGAGPMHAAGIASELGIERILCPRAGGVLSALGLCASDRRRDTTRTVMLSGAELTSGRIAAEVERLRHVLGDDIDGAVDEIVYEMRYAGQAFELSIPGGPRPDPADLVERFAASHRERYGHDDPDAEVVLVDIRLALVAAGPRPRPAAANGELAEGTREVHFEGGPAETRVLRGDPPGGTEVEGPAIFELPESTLVVPPGWSASVDDAGTIHARSPAAGGTGR